MEKDLLVILMVAFGLFAIVMFVLFFVYLKKYYNSKRIEDDYKKVDEDTLDEIKKEKLKPAFEEKKDEFKEEKVEENSHETVSFEKMNSSIKEVPFHEDNSPKVSIDDEMDFIPIKKK